MNEQPQFRLLAWVVALFVPLGLIAFLFRSVGVLGFASVFALLYIGVVAATELLPADSLTGRRRGILYLSLVVGFVIWFTVISSRILALFS